MFPRRELIDGVADSASDVRRYMLAVKLIHGLGGNRILVPVAQIRIVERADDIAQRPRLACRLVASVDLLLTDRPGLNLLAYVVRDRIVGDEFAGSLEGTERAGGFGALRVMQRDLLVCVCAVVEPDERVSIRLAFPSSVGT